MKTTISTQAGAVEPLVIRTDDYAPDALVEKAREIEQHFKMAGCDKWELAGICSRNHALENAKLLIEREALLAVAEAANYAWAIGQVVGQSRLKLDTALANLAALRKAVQS